MENTNTEAPEVQEQKPAETPPAEEKATHRQHEENTSGFYIYLGPTIRGVIQNGQIFRGTRDQAYNQAKAAIRKYKLVRTLIVSGDNLPTARLKVREKGNAFYVNYHKLQRNMLEKRVRDEEG